MTPSKPFLPQLRSHIEGDFLVAGIGNEFKELDRIGIDIAREGRELYPDKFMECGVVPENYLDRIINKKVRTLILVDVVCFEYGDKVKVFLPEELSMQGISTHSIPLKVMAEYLIRYGIKTVIVGLKPDRDIEETKENLLSYLLELAEDAQACAPGQHQDSKNWPPPKQNC